MANTTQASDDEITNKLLEIFSANFNDGEPITLRIKSKDMYSTDSIVDFLWEFVTPFIHHHTATAIKRALKEQGTHLRTLQDNAIKQTDRLARIDELQKTIDDKPLTTMDLILNLYVERMEKRIAELNRTEGETDDE